MLDGRPTMVVSGFIVKKQMIYQFLDLQENKYKPWDFVIDLSSCRDGMKVKHEYLLSFTRPQRDRRTIL
jgi:hypothetical protein